MNFVAVQAFLKKQTKPSKKPNQPAKRFRIKQKLKVSRLKKIIETIEEIKMESFLFKSFNKINNKGPKN